MQFGIRQLEQNKKITYPDAEEASYLYNFEGMLKSVKSLKGDIQYAIVDSIGYDEQGRRNYMAYGNGTETFYEYDQDRGFLETLQSLSSGGDYMQDNAYSFDLAGNIDEIINNAGVTSNGLGGTSTYQYTYDSLYRLTEATGNWNNGDDHDFELQMNYSLSGKILNKTETADVLDASGSVTQMSLDYSYAYNTSQPHTINNISGSDDHNFEWDANGNMTYYQYEQNNDERYHCWDEENRLMGVNNDNTLAHYISGAGGERAMKFTGQLSTITLNNDMIVNHALMDDYTYYVNPMMVLTQGDYTKHYYIEGQRIMSKIGGGMSENLIGLHEEPSEPPVEMNLKGEAIHDNLIDVIECQEDQGQIDYDLDFDWLNDMVEQENEENDQYFFHSDHLGSSSFISDVNGDPTQHLEYLPFGEPFIEERIDWGTPYKFSGKELDQETQYYYFGARYYDPKISIWLSVDPKANEFPSHSPYNYTLNNPIMLIDPNGLIPWPISKTGNGTGWNTQYGWFGEKRGNRLHRGVDINKSTGGNSDLGLPVYSTHTGVVVSVKKYSSHKNGGGTIVMIQAPDGSFQTVYMHLNSVDVCEGDEVSEGQMIGTIGKTGFGKKDAYPAHLHYEIRKKNKDGKYVAINPESKRGVLIDPQNWISPIEEDLELPGLNLYLGETFLSPAPERSFIRKIFNEIVEWYRGPNQEPDADFWIRYENQKASQKQ